MRRLILFIAAIFFLPIAGYAAFALRGDNSTDPIVKLIGPGKTPSQCVSRLRPHFERMQPHMTEIANALLASSELSGVLFGYDRADEPFLWINYNTELRDPTSDEKQIFFPRFQSFGKRNYYASFHFSEGNGHIIAYSAAECGVPLHEWVRVRIGLGWSEKQYPAGIGRITYIYEPDGVGDFEKCVEPLGMPDPVIGCGVALNENWVWHSEWWEPLDPPN